MWSRRINKDKSKKQALNEHLEMQHGRSELEAKENKREHVDKLSGENHFDTVSQQIGRASDEAEKGELIQQNEEKFRKVFEAAPDAIFMVNQDGKIKLVNHSTEKMFGYCREELIGESVDILFPERFHSKHFEFRSDLYMNPKERLMGAGNALFAIRKDGSEFSVDISLKTVETDEGLMVLSFVKDIADRRRAEEEVRSSEERYRALYDENPSMYFTVSTGGKIISVNHFGAEQLGYTVEELVGQPVLNVFYKEDRKAVENCLNVYLQNPKKTANWEFRKVRKDGSLLWVREFVRIMRQKDGTTVLLIVCEDIDDRKQAEEVINRNLELLSKKNRYEGIIRTVTQSVHRSIDLQEVLDNAVDAMSRNIDEVDNVSIFLVEGNEAVLKSYTGAYPDWYLKRVERIAYPKGATWKTIVDGKMIYVEDVDRDEVIGPAGREMGTKSYASIPIGYNGTTVGVMNINSFHKNAFDEEELKLLVMVSQQIEIAINNAQQAEELKQTREELTHNLDQLSKKSVYEKIISNVTQSVHQSIDLQEVFKNAVDSMSKNVDKSDAISIYTIEGEEAVLRTHVGYSEEYLKKASRIAYPKGATWKTIIGGKSIYCPDVGQDTVIGQAGKNLGINSYLTMPIFTEAKAEGVITIMSYEKNAFDQDELKLLDIVAKQITVALRNAQQAEALRVSEEALKRAKQGLEHRVRERTKELFHANKELRNEIERRESAEERLKLSLNEKETLLMEIQHRVKNNLQVITSLLDLQKDYVKEKGVRNDFIEIQSRIRSMALIHEQIYQSKDLTKIDFAEYVTTLVAYLFDSYGMSSRVIKLKNNIGEPSMNVDRGLTCGMIVNELVSNSLKHAFPEGNGGEIFIDLHPENNNCVLIIGDDGIGFPKGLNFRKTKTLGLQLVISLTRQIEGSIRLNRRDGTEFKIEFPEH